MGAPFYMYVKRTWILPRTILLVEISHDNHPTWTSTNHVCSDMLEILDSAEAENSDVSFEVDDSVKEIRALMYMAPGRCSFLGLKLWKLRLGLTPKLLLRATPRARTWTSRSRLYVSKAFPTIIGRIKLNVDGSREVLISRLAAC